VYTAEDITSEGILNDTFLESDSTGWSTAYKFIYETDCSSERKSNFYENNYTATGPALSWHLLLIILRREFYQNIMTNNVDGSFFIKMITF